MLDRSHTIPPGAILQSGRFIGSLSSMDEAGVRNADQVVRSGLDGYLSELEVTQRPRKVLSITSPDGREILTIEALGYSIDEADL